MRVLYRAIIVAISLALVGLGIAMITTNTLSFILAGIFSIVFGAYFLKLLEYT